MNPLPWLQEKTLRALEEAARLVDLANERDTSAWYAKELKRRAHALIGNLAPVVSLVHGSPDAAGSDEWSGVVERGSFALAGWCKKHDIQDPTARSFDLLAREHADAGDKAERPADDAQELDGPQVLALRCDIYSCATRRMLDDIPDAARKLYLWALYHLHLAERPDVVRLSRRFLPTDIGLDPEETATAYRWLVEHAFLERVDGETSTDDGLHLKIVAPGVNESKQPLAAGDISFGYPGARVGGKPTTGNVIRVQLPSAYLATLRRWQFAEEDRKSLASALQAHLGAERAYVEEVVLGDHDTSLRVRLRQPWDQDDDALSASLEAAALTWLRTRLAPSSVRSRDES